MNHALKFSLPPLGPVAVPVLPAAGRPDKAFPQAVPPLPQSRTFVMAYVVSAITSAGKTRLVSFLALNTVCPDDVLTLATRDGFAYTPCAAIVATPTAWSSGETSSGPSVMSGTSARSRYFGMPASYALATTLSGPILSASGTKMVLTDFASASVNVHCGQGPSSPELWIVVPLTSTLEGPENRESRLMPSFSRVIPV